MKTSSHHWFIVIAILSIPIYGIGQQQFTSGLYSFIQTTWQDSSLNQRAFHQQLDSLTSLHPAMTVDSIFKTAIQSHPCSTHHCLDKLLELNKWKRKQNATESDILYLILASRMAIDISSEKAPEILLKLAHLQSRYGFLSDAIKSYKDFLTRYSKMVPQKNLITAHLRLGGIYALLSNRKAGRFYLIEGIRILEESANPEDIVSSYRMAGIAAKSIDTLLAKNLLRKSIRSMNDSTPIAQRLSSYGNLAELLFPDSLEKAHKYLNIPRKHYLNTKTPASFNYTMTKCKYHFRKSQSDSLNYFLSKLKDVPSYNMNLDFVSLTKQIEAAKGNYRKAYQLYHQEIHLKDSIYNLKNNQIIFDLEEKYKSAQKQATINQLNSENQLSENRLLQKNRFLSVISILSLVLFFTTIYLYQIYQKNNRLLSLVSKQNKTITAQLAQEKVLKREVHHRVKNNLQVISSLFSIQANYSGDPQATRALKEAQNRVKSMSLIHQQLHHPTAVDQFSIDQYITELSQQLIHSYSIQDNEIQLVTNIENVPLDLDTMTYIGLVLNELISNSLKHGKNKGNKHIVNIEVERKDKFFTISVHDNGCGFSRPLHSILNSSSFGIQLIQSMINRLEGILCVGNYHGAYVKFSVPLPHSKK